MSEIIRATTADLANIVSMKLAMFDEAGHAKLLAENAFDLILQDYQSLYAQGLAQHFLQCQDTHTIAMAGAFIKSDLPFRYFSSPAYGFLGDVYTHTAYRGQGLASALSDAAIAWLKGQGVGMVRLLASDAARAMYAKKGFVATDEMCLPL